MTMQEIETPETPTRWQMQPTIAVDTEYCDAHTLTVQTAARFDDNTLVVQVYRSPAVPGLPPSFNQEQYLPEDRYGRVLIRPVRLLTPDLSPLRMLRDLFDCNDLYILTRREGRQLKEQFGAPDVMVPENVLQVKGRNRWRVPTIDLTVVGHFLTADFCRLWGRDFLDELLADGVNIRCRKLIGFADAAKKYGSPIIEYAAWGTGLYETHMKTQDTILPFGTASLDTHSKTFLGFGKNETLAEEDKRDMLQTFHARTADAYGYAMADALNTLLVFEQMKQKDRDIYRSFGFTDQDIPPLRHTLGSRVSTFLLRATPQAAGECHSLSSGRSLEALMKNGGMSLFQTHPEASRYGTQTAKVHGGLLYSRSPTKFWHASPGMLRDVDMSGCYQRIINGMNVYWGRPVIHEPGSKPLPLKAAVDLVRRHANADGWFIRVSGDIRGFPNALIPSTENAVTSGNYRQKLRHGKRREAKERAFHLEALRDPGCVHGMGGSRLYASCVESGIVTWATWLLIQALPPEVREQYERLTADTLVFYPRWLAAEDGAEFDALIEKYRNEALPWEAELDLEAFEHVQREKIDAEFVTLKFPLGEYAQRIGDRRKEAQAKEGKGSGADLAWKQHGNTIYGVLSSSHLPTHNFTSGNVITAYARAMAFAMSQALNAIQTITDGCTYRLDQIPACTFAECLRIRPDYTIRRVEDGDGIPFLDPNTIPQDDPGFTRWLREHVKQFFGVEGPDYVGFFTTHDLEHKTTGSPKKPAFDALACDGAANYLKASQDKDGNWNVLDFAARSYGRESKEILRDWLVQTYSTDHMCDPPPITEDGQLLSFDQARKKADHALAGGVPEVVFPLRLDHRKVSTYRALKASAFVFETPEQRTAILKQVQKFEEKTGAGLELLSMRRTYGERRQGSLSNLAEDLYILIRAGGDNVTKSLNLNKLKGPPADLADERTAEIQARKARIEAGLLARIDTRNLDQSILTTAYLLRAGEVAA